ncbi:MAG: NapC/NirT family cytochrome c [Bacillus sp. (in: Bacteria)]|nr:NapC/NirT family cytochrome c [Bacillus sp. (in: firmicutes)]
MSDKEIKEEQEKVKFREKLKIWKKIDLKNPLHMWKLIFFSIVFLLIAFGSTYGVFKATGTNSSCASCHIHPPEVVTHELTTHTELYCTDCHVEPGFDNYIMSKVMVPIKCSS